MQVLQHNGINLRCRGHTTYIAISELTARHVTIYGQHELLKDLIACALDRGLDLRFQVAETAVHDLDSGRPRITYADGTGAQELDCDFIAGCDGFHGVCRPSVPDGVLTIYDYTYPFGWLGILAEAPPATDELIYAWHERGFALYSIGLLCGSVGYLIAYVVIYGQPSA